MRKERECLVFMTSQLRRKGPSEASAFLCRTDNKKRDPSQKQKEKNANQKKTFGSPWHANIFHIFRIRADIFELIALPHQKNLICICIFPTFSHGKIWEKPESATCYAPPLCSCSSSLHACGPQDFIVGEEDTFWGCRPTLPACGPTSTALHLWGRPLKQR